ncbi:putative porin [Psychroserpens luteolus]|uniref:putative porin n=1 Tax=Psychroserpens luteolus TaxID=2855840 RepID=UPI001E3AF9F1|nr:putative porin [Psychroserpens luteolus]MCD2260064.1 putative porin [Psychroserpens luteolus]
MFRTFIVYFFIIFSVSVLHTQTLEPNKNLKSNKKVLQPNGFNDSTSTRKKSNKVNNSIAKIEQYKIYDVEGNVEYIDTSLTIQKQYKFNYLRKDNFGLMQFANIGQTYNQLSRDISHDRLLPQFGARARHFNYMEVDYIRYYEVPTPLTELFFKTAFKQGQLLDAFFTVNTSRYFNFSIAYKGLRSLGNYQHALTSTGNLRFTTNYRTKNGKYKAKAHITTQDLENQENGGLKEEDIPNFTSGNEDFIDRGVFDPNFENAENILVGKRFYLNHQYEIIQPSDSLGSILSLKNILNFEDKYFQFDQTTRSDFFGESFNQSNIKDRATLENFHAELSINYAQPIIGNVDFGIGYNDINYGYDKVTILNDQQIPNRIKDQILNVNGNYYNQFDKFRVDFGFGVNVIGDFEGNYFLGEVQYKFSEDLDVKGTLGTSSQAPNYNLLLNQSDYINYNWDNISNFKNQKNTSLTFDFASKKLLDISLKYMSIDNFSFFATEEESGAVKPNQLSQSLDIFKVRLDKEFKYGKFALDNSILYQKVNDESKSLNLPEVVVRNTLYYSNHFFKKKALYLQTGITFNYFTDYYMDSYDPLLAEFYTQNKTKIGGFPRLDFFVNAKIRQTRFFFKFEHFNASFTGYDYFSAPNNPYRDFNFRFGLVWDFFL